MFYINAIIFGVVQGLTEFLPVSSSGHLVVLHELLELPIKSELAFDVVLHFATLLAVVYFFRKDIWRIIKSFVYSPVSGGNQYSRLGWLLIIGTIPAAIAGFFFEDIIESALREPWVVIAMLALIGLLFIIAEKKSKQSRVLSDLNLRKVLIIGLAQAIALIPGTSRSGITIIAGLGVKLRREEALRFSFLLSVPIIFGATIKKIPDIIGINLSGGEGAVLAVSFICAYAAAVLAIKYFMRFARAHSLNVFAYYRFILAAALAVYFYL